MTDTEQQTAAISEILRAVVDAVKVAGTTGAPGGVIYSALMAHGCSQDHYNAIMAALVRAGKITQRGHLYFAL